MLLESREGPDDSMVCPPRPRDKDVFPHLAPDGVRGVKLRSDLEEVSHSAVITPFKDVDWVARRITTMLVVER